MKDVRKRSRMVFEIPEDIRVAIRLKAAKILGTNNDVLCAAIREVFPEEVKEAVAVLKEQKK